MKIILNRNGIDMFMKEVNLKYCMEKFGCVLILDLLVDLQIWSLNTI